LQPTNGRPRVFYVSYDGIEEPLGRSQVLAYLVRLAQEYAITLVSFEKDPGPRDSTYAELRAAGIEWRPLSYHKRPPVLSTILDVWAGRRALVRAARRGPPTILHVRSYVPALIALLARRRTGGRFLFDIRGFWADERVEGGLWRPDGFLYRLAKRCEQWFFREADAVVTLTNASLPQIRSWLGQRKVPVEVIPTCVELQRFLDRPHRPGGPHAVWSGSIGTWYRFDLAAPAASALGIPLSVLTRQAQLAHQILDDGTASVQSVPPEEVPLHMFAGDIGLCLIVSSFSKTASAPTRFAEYLAAGMPTLVTGGVGDLEGIVERHRVGAVLRGSDARALADAVTRLRVLLVDESVQERCRAVARELFDVEAGTAKYAALYRRLI
jgi:glycosyltransferase involved in cell wall biosynthesis